MFLKDRIGLLLHNYYGPKVNYLNFEGIKQKLEGGAGTSIVYEGEANMHMDLLDLEYSTVGIGDFRKRR